MLTRPFLVLLGATVLVLGGFTLLLPVVPLRLTELGGGPVVAGAATAVFMAATVGTQLRTPRLLRTRGHRWVLVVGGAALGLPALLYPLVGGAAPVLALTAARGCGFGLLTVAAGALVAELVEPRALGRASAVYGVVVGLPQLVALPVGLAVVAAHGTTPVLLAGGALPLAGAVVAVALPATRPARPDLPAPRLTPRTVAAPVVGLAVVALSFGATLTFLPLAVSTEPAVVGIALFVLSTALLVGRGLAGPLTDLLGGGGRLLGPGVLLAAAGAGVLALGVRDASGTALLVGAALFGAGFGVVQNDSLVLLFARAGPARFGPASAAWNVAFDAGTGLGAVVLGVVVAVAGFAVAFAVTAVLVGLVGLGLWAGGARTD